MKKINFDNKSLGIKQGDITKEDTDAIVNAANNYLRHSTGVARAIAKAAGEQLEKESQKIDFVPTGMAAITVGGNLLAKYVIHAVGPVWKDGHSDEDEKLENSVIESLKLAEKSNLKTIAFPAISTGIFGFPIKKASRILLNTTKRFLTTQANSLNEIWFVLFSPEDYDVFAGSLREIS